MSISRRFFLGASLVAPSLFLASREEAETPPEFKFVEYKFSSEHRFILTAQTDATKNGLYTAIPVTS